MESSSLAIQIDKPEKAEINQRNPINVFQFIPPEDISKTQLDVTVTSDSDVPAYLKVSRDCKDVKDNIRLVDYKGESIRLSFAKKGRITLSKVSIPPLTDSASPWFIGIALKNESGKTKSEARKNVTLTLTRSFDYNNSGPIRLLVIFTTFSGILVSFFAFLCFKELFCAQNAYCCYARGDCNCSCRFCDHVILCLKVMSNHWFTQGPKTFLYITAIVIGASQFVFANWHVMIHEGDRDNCYYNDFCYRVSPWHDIPFNLMISNLTYILHGVILAVSVCLMEARHPIDGEEFKGKFSFSIGYAFAWALIFKGCFSLIYHLCPSQMTFQFDTALMFVGFTVVLLYNGILKSVIPSDDAKGLMGAANFFLYFLVPLFIFNYFGALHHFEMHNSKEGMRKSFEIPLFVSVVMKWVLISIWAAYKLSATLCSGTQSCSDKFCHCGRITFAFCVAAQSLYSSAHVTFRKRFCIPVLRRVLLPLSFPILSRRTSRIEVNFVNHCVSL